MNRSARIFLLLFAIGIVIIAIPDNNVRLVRLNQHHGLSAQDLAGIILILVCWQAGLALIIRRRKIIVNRLGKILSLSFLIFYFISISGILAGLILTAEPILWISASMAAIINLIFFVYAIGVPKPIQNMES